MALLAPAASADAQPHTGAMIGAGSSAYPAGDFHRQLDAAGGNGADAYDWGWGAGGSPFRTGPGRCDDWRVGPVWQGRVDGVVYFRDQTDVNALAAGATAGGAAIPVGGDTLTTNFDHAAGVRLSLTGAWPQCSGYEVNVGYLGVFGWDAGAFDPGLPATGVIGPQPDLITQRSVSYRSSLHSLELNGQTTGGDRLKVFGGVRYVRLAEDIDDRFDESSPVPSLSGVATADLELTDILRNVNVNNNLIGFQGGLRSDLISLGDRLHLSGFTGAGVYCNLIRRSSRFSQVDSFLRADDPATPAPMDESLTVTASTESGFKSNEVDVAFIGEAALNAVYQVNACTTATVGYQLLYLEGVGLGDSAFLTTAATTDDLLLHGWFAGVEYRR